MPPDNFYKNYLATGKNLLCTIWYENWRQNNIAMDNQAYEHLYAFLWSDCSARKKDLAKLLAWTVLNNKRKGK